VIKVYGSRAIVLATKRSYPDGAVQSESKGVIGKEAPVSTKNGAVFKWAVGTKLEVVTKLEVEGTTGDVEATVGLGSTVAGGLTVAGGSTVANGSTVGATAVADRSGVGSEARMSPVREAN